MRNYLQVFTVCAAILSMSMSVKAQTAYERIINYNSIAMHTYDMVSVADTNTVVVGEYHHNFKGLQAMVCRLGSNGKPMWATLFGGQQDDHAVSVELVNGSLYVLAETKSYGSSASGDSDFELVKMDLNGDVIWAKAYGGSYDENPRQLMYSAADTTLVMVGGTHSYSVTNSANSAVWVVKVKLDGTRVWARAFAGESSIDIANNLAINESGNIYVVGAMASYGAGNSDAFYSYLGKNGHLLNTKTYGFRKADVALDIAIRDSNRIVISGNVRHPFSITQRDPLLMDLRIRNSSYYKIDSLSDHEGRVEVEWSGDDSIGYYVGGWTKSVTNGKQAYFACVIDTGLDTVSWFKVYGNKNYDDNAHSILLDGNGLSITGSSNQNGGSFTDIFQVRTGTNGIACDSGINVTIDTISLSTSSPSVNQDTTSSIYIVDSVQLDRTFSSYSVCVIANKRSLTSISEPQSDDFGLYPNPTSGLLYLKNVPEWANQLQVISVDGKIVLSQKITSSQRQFNLSHLNNGIYLVVVIGVNQINQTRIIKQ